MIHLTMVVLSAMALPPCTPTNTPYSPPEAPLPLSALRQPHGGAALTGTKDGQPSPSPLLEAKQESFTGTFQHFFRHVLSAGPRQHGSNTLSVEYSRFEHQYHQGKDGNITRWPLEKQSDFTALKNHPYSAIYLTSRRVQQREINPDENELKWSDVENISSGNSQLESEANRTISDIQSKNRNIFLKINRSTNNYSDPVSPVTSFVNSNLTNYIISNVKDSIQYIHNCDKVKRSTDSLHSRREVKERPTTLEESPPSLQGGKTIKKNKNTSSTEDSERTLIQRNVTDSRSPVRARGTSNSTTRVIRRRRGRRRHRPSKDLSLWIDERQVRLFSGYVMEIFVIHDGRVLPYILDPNFERHLPVIPYEVQSVNFTWQAGRKRYYYTFDRLHSHDPLLLEPPVVSLPLQGRIPRKPKVFTVNINCSGNATGIASFDIGLLIQTRRGKPMAGTPLRLKLRKECTQPSADPECDEKCENGGVCDAGRKCQCPEGYMGPYCNTALCYPQCMNGGTCTTPGRCTCPPGYQGRHCEGGICAEKCENGGKCIQKDTCSCPRGYYGNRCEFSKCVIPCINGGKCRNVNKCRCPRGFAGDHCEVVTGNSVGPTALARCSRKCRRGSCKGAACVCQEGFTGRWCRRRGAPRKRLWM